MCFCHSSNVKRTLLAGAVLAFLLPLLSPAAMGHAAPPPRGFEDRLLHDHNDDAALVLAGQHGFDAIAMDGRTAWIPGTGAAVVFRLILNGGCDEALPTECGTLRHDLLFTHNGTEHRIAFVTADGGATWTGDAVRYVGPQGINDGTRFAIEGWVPLANLNASVGDAIGDLFVEGYHEDEEGDHMPQGIVAGTDDPTEAAMDIGSYTLAAPDFYLDAAADRAQVTAAAGQLATVPFTVTNLLATGQVVDLDVDGPPGTQVMQSGQRVSSLDLAANFTDHAELVVEAAPGPVTVTVTSDLGGLATLRVDVATETEDASLGPVRSPVIASGAAWSVRLPHAGTLNLSTEGGDTLAVTVEPDGAAATTVAYQGGFAPTQTTLAPNGTLTLRNEAATPFAVAGDYEPAPAATETGGSGNGIPGPPAGVLAALLVGGAIVAARRRR